MNTTMHNSIPTIFIVANLRILKMLFYFLKQFYILCIILVFLFSKVDESHSNFYFNRFFTSIK